MQISKPIISLAMHCILMLCACILLVSLPSCQKCELIEQEIVYPATPCSGTFYFSKLESLSDTSFTFNTINYPLPGLINPVQKAGPFSTYIYPSDMRSNYSAYDSVNGIYVFEFFSTSNPSVGFFSNQTHSNISTNSTFNDFYISPVFQDENLYVIHMETFGSDLQYSIGEVNPITGQDGVGLTGNTVTTNSPADAQGTSSAAGKNNLVYFLSGTNLIEFNALNNTTQHFDIDLSFDLVNNPVGYAGLEYDSNQDLFFALKYGPDGLGGFKLTLVSIKVLQSSTQVTQVFNLTDHFPAGHSPFINSDFFSTTFVPCDTTYYVAELKGVNPLTTNLIEVNLNRQTLNIHEMSGYCFGFEFEEE